MPTIKTNVTELVAFSECEQKGMFLRAQKEAAEIRRDAKRRGTLAHAIVERQNKAQMKKGGQNGSD